MHIKLKWSLSNIFVEQQFGVEGTTKEYRGGGPAVILDTIKAIAAQCNPIQYEIQCNNNKL